MIQTYVSSVRNFEISNANVEIKNIALLLYK